MSFHSYAEKTALEAFRKRKQTTSNLYSKINTNRHSQAHESHTYVVKHRKSRKYQQRKAENSKQQQKSKKKIKQISQHRFSG